MIPPSTGESFRLDYVLVSKQCEPLTVEILKDVRLSDHHPLYVHIKLHKATQRGSMNSFGKEYSSDVTGDGPKTPPKSSGIRQYFVPHTAEPVDLSQAVQALSEDQKGPFSPPARQCPEAVAVPLDPDLNQSRPSRRNNRVWLISHGTNAGQIYDVYETARLAAINTGHQSRGNTRGFPTRELALKYAQLHVFNTLPVTAEPVEETAMDMSNISEALASLDSDTSSPPAKCRPLPCEEAPMRMDLLPVGSSDLMAPVLRYSYMGHGHQLTDVGRSLQSYGNVEALRIIAIARGDRITMELADELQYPDNRYLVALTQDVALNCSAYTECQRPECLFSMANNAVDLIDHWERTLL